MRVARVTCSGYATPPKSTGPCRATVPGAPSDWHGHNMGAPHTIGLDGRAIALRVKSDRPASVDAKLAQIMVAPGTWGAR